MIKKKLIESSDCEQFIGAKWGQMIEMHSCTLSLNITDVTHKHNSGQHFMVLVLNLYMHCAEMYS